MRMRPVAGRLTVLKQVLIYGGSVGVGRQGFGWSGSATVHNKQEWPDWYPPKEMIARQPEIRRQMSELRSGLGEQGAEGLACEQLPQEHERPPALGVRSSGWGEAPARGVR